MSWNLIRRLTYNGWLEPRVDVWELRETYKWPCDGVSERVPAVFKYYRILGVLLCLRSLRHLLVSRLGPCKSRASDDSNHQRYQYGDGSDGNQP